MTKANSSYWKLVCVSPAVGSGGDYQTDTEGWTEDLCCL